jgi:hypothetical protein
MDIKELAAVIGLVKDIVLTLGGITTIALGIYGLRIWKRDLIGKEAYSVISVVVRNLHRVSSGCQKLREPVKPNERRELSDVELQHLTQNEQWRVVELDVFKNRADKLALVMDEFNESLLSARVLLGSSVYATTLQFRGVISECINTINEYLDLLKDQNLSLGENSPQVLIAQEATFLGRDLDDPLTAKLAQARESAETALLRYLHRNTIRGDVVGKAKGSAALKEWRTQYEERKARNRSWEDLYY